MAKNKMPVDQRLCP